MTTTIQQIESTLSADWQKFLAFFNNAEQNIQTFLAQVAAGGQVLETDINNVLSQASGKLAQVSQLLPILEVALNAIAPGSGAVTAIIAEITTGIADVAQIITGVQSGAAPSGADAIVTDVVAAITKLYALIALANQASTQIGQLTIAAPAATQVVSPPTPNEG